MNWCANIMEAKSQNKAEMDAFLAEEVGEIWYVEQEGDPISLDVFEVKKVIKKIPFNGNEDQVSIFVHEKENTAQFHFYTPYAGPSDDWLAALSHKYPSLTFQLYSCEPLLEYYHVAIVDNGKTQEPTEKQMKDFLSFCKQAFPDDYDSEKASNAEVYQSAKEVSVNLSQGYLWNLYYKVLLVLLLLIPVIAAVRYIRDIFFS